MRAAGKGRRAMGTRTTKCCNLQYRATTESKEMRIKNPSQNFRGCMEGGTGLANKFAGIVSIETSKCIMQAMDLGGAAARRP